VQTPDAALRLMHGVSIRDESDGNSSSGGRRRKSSRGTYMASGNSRGHSALDVDAKRSWILNDRRSSAESWCDVSVTCFDASIVTRTTTCVRRAVATATTILCFNIKLTRGCFWLQVTTVRTARPIVLRRRQCFLPTQRPTPPATPDPTVSYHIETT